MKVTKAYVNTAGYCLAEASHAVKYDKSGQIKFNALFVLINHPKHGWMLMDTGYSRQFYQATAYFPNKIYALITKVFITEEEEIQTQLHYLGLKCADIKYIIITHFHADHIAALKDFPLATIFCSQESFLQLKKIPAVFGFSKGILHGLIPSDLENRVKFFDNPAHKTSDPIFDWKYDLFGDDSIYIYPLPGHACGQVGLMLETDTKKYFFVSDACWTERAYKQLALPHPIVRLFFYSWKKYKQTIYQLAIFHRQNTEVLIVPTHCNVTTSKLLINKSGLNEI